MYYYPYLLAWINFYSFTHYNSLSNDDIQSNPYNSITEIPDSNETGNVLIDRLHRRKPNTSIKLWSITRSGGAKHRKRYEYTASYNFYTKNYDLDGKRYLSYNDLVNDAYLL